jgi:hypothetical protein
MIRVLAIAAAVALCAATAHAQTAQDLRAAVLPNAHPAESMVKDAGPARQAGIAQTSLERRFAHDKAAGSVGFLCGRDEDKGGPTAFGDDPHGRFLGARLSLAIR